MRIILLINARCIDMLCIARSVVPHGTVVCINEFMSDPLASYLVCTLLQLFMP